MDRRRFSRWVLAGAIFAVACTAGDKSPPLGPNLAIFDGAHAGGAAGFYFLPPMVPSPVTSGVFDPDIATVNPVILICDVTDGYLWVWKRQRDGTWAIWREVWNNGPPP